VEYWPGKFSEEVRSKNEKQMRKKEMKREKEERKEGRNKQRRTEGKQSVGGKVELKVREGDKD